jgi:hypothetical protein
VALGKEAFTECFFLHSAKKLFCRVFFIYSAKPSLSSAEALSSVFYLLGKAKEADSDSDKYILFQ